VDELTRFLREKSYPYAVKELETVQEYANANGSVSQTPRHVCVEVYGGKGSVAPPLVIEAVLLCVGRP
jgi:hypothetical protein